MRGDFMFGMEGPVMEGNWYNPQTGDSFTVRNSFFEDNQYIVQTTDGRILNFNQIQNYIKSDKPVDMQNSNQNNNSSLPREVMDIIEKTEENDLMNEVNELLTPKPLGNLNDSKLTTYNPLSTSFNSNNNIIEKALSKRSLPDLQVGIDWKDFPRREINMLIELMDVTEDEIINWYINQVDINYLSDCLKSVLKGHIHTQIFPTLSDITLPSQSEVITISEPTPDMVGDPLDGGAMAKEPKSTKMGVSKAISARKSTNKSKKK